MSQYSPNDIWYLFEEENPHLEENILHGLEVAIDEIKKRASDHSKEFGCEEKCPDMGLICIAPPI